MSEIKRLTKAEILAGKSLIHYLYVEELGGEIGLKPLTERQYAQVEAIKTSGSKLTGAPVYDVDGNPDFNASVSGMLMEVDLGETVMKEFEAAATAVAYSLVTGDGEHWDVDDVMSIQPPGIVEKLAEKVYEISGIKSSAKDQEKVKSFRDQSRGAGDNPAPLKRPAPSKRTRRIDKTTG